MDQRLVDRINGFWVRLGIKPAVGNAFITGIIATLAYWLIDGGTFNAAELRLVGGTFLLTLVGALSPPAPGTVMTKGGVVPRNGEDARGDQL